MRQFFIFERERERGGGERRGRGEGGKRGREEREIYAYTK